MRIKDFELQACQHFLTGEIEGDYDMVKALEKLEFLNKEQPEQTTDLAAEAFENWTASDLYDSIKLLSKDFKNVYYQGQAVVTNSEFSLNFTENDLNEMSNRIYKTKHFATWGSTSHDKTIQIKITLGDDE